MRSGGGTGSALAFALAFALAAVATSLAGAGVLTGATGAADAKFSCRRPSPTVVVWPKDGGQEEAKDVEGEVKKVEEVEEVCNGWLPLKPGSLSENAEFSQRWYAGELGTQFKHLRFSCTQEHLTQRPLLLHEQHRAGLGALVDSSSELRSTVM